MDDRAQAGLRGPVKTCRTEHISYTRDCSGKDCRTEERVWEDSHTYDRDGKLLEHSHRNPDGSEWITNRRYEDARLAAIESRGSGGEVSMSVYHYDEAGRLERVTSGEDTTESWRYDSAGRMTKTRPIRLAPDGRPIVYGVDGSQMAYSAPGSTSMITLYDGAARPLETQFLDEAGVVLQRVLLVYDHAGRVIEETLDAPAAGLPEEARRAMGRKGFEAVAGLLAQGGGRKITHRYDDRGRRIETVHRHGAFSTERSITEYNEHDDPAVVRSARESAEFGFGLLGGMRETKRTERAWENRWEYQYDERGNWTEQILRHVSHGAQPVIAHIDRRELEYWQ